jgi:hypothetical protein
MTDWSSHLIVDPTHDGLAVARFSLPPGWQAQSQVVWNFQDTSQPVTVRAVATGPNGRDVVEFLPYEACCWVQPYSGFQQPGSRRFGLTLLPPMPAIDAMVQFLIPKHRGDPRNYRVVGASPIPDLPQQIGAPELAALPAGGAVVRVEADVNGSTIVEEVYACHYVLAPVPGQVVQQNWGLVRSFALRSDRDHFDQQRADLWRIATSIVYHHEWQQLSERVLQRLNGQFVEVMNAGFDKLRTEAAFEQQFLAYNQQVRDNQSAAVGASVAHQQQVNAARWAPPGVGGGGGQSAQDALGDQLLGRQAYDDPNNPEGNYWYDQGNHQYVWTDGQGQFIPTDDPNLDPNIGSDRSWTLANRA